MTAHDSHLALQDGSPWHFKLRADGTENAGATYRADDARDDEADGRADYSFADAVADDEEAVNPLAIAVVAAALAVGIGVGAGATALWTSLHHARRPPAVAAMSAPPTSRPAPLAVAPAAPPVEASAPAPEAKSTPPRVHRSSARPTAAPTGLATACSARGSRREVLICDWPEIAAADREMRRAYQHALEAGVERGSLQASQDRWLTASEFAAHRSAADLATAYHRQIGELNELAAEEPPH